MAFGVVGPGSAVVRECVEGGLGLPRQAGVGGAGPSVAEDLDDAEGGFVEVAVVVGVVVREVVAGEGIDEGRV
jgi:hypothetical protein